MWRPARAHETPQLLLLPWSGGVVRHVRAQLHAQDPKRPRPTIAPSLLVQVAELIPG
jgi:hypothetical protein